MNLFILSRFIFSSRSPNRLRCRGAALHSYIDGKTDSREQRDQTGQSVADKGKRYACVGQESCRHTDIHKSLESDPGSHAARDQPACQIIRFLGDLEAPDRNGGDQEDNGTGPDKAEFLADDGKDKVGLGFGNKARLQQGYGGFQAPLAQKPARTDGGDGLHGLIGCRRGVILRMQPGQDPLLLVAAQDHPVQDHEKEEARYGDQDSQNAGHELIAQDADEHQDTEDDHDHQAGGQIGLNDDQSHRQKGQAAADREQERGAHFVPVFHYELGKK